MTDNKEKSTVTDTETSEKASKVKQTKKSKTPKSEKDKKAEGSKKSEKKAKKASSKSEEKKASKAKSEEKKASKAKSEEKKASKAKSEEKKASKAKSEEKKDSKATEKSESKKKKKKAKKKTSKIGNIKYLGGFLFKKMAFGGAEELSSNADEVNRLNVFPVPDGDTGDNMRMTIESGISEMGGVNSDNIGKVIQSLSHGMLLGARGNSGVILSQFFAGTAKGLESASKADPETLGKALELGVQQA